MKYVAAKKIAKHQLTLIMSVILLSACGGGGDNNPRSEITPPPSPQPPLNIPPVANDDAAELFKNRSHVIDVLRNDTDPENAELTLVRILSVQHGSAIVQVDKTILYTPAIAYVGSDTLVYVIEDPQKAQAQASVLITVMENVAPVAHDDQYDLERNTSLNLNLVNNDSDPESEMLRIVDWSTSSLSGTLTRLTTGRLRYTPATDFNGTAVFEYTIEDPSNNRASANVTLNVSIPVAKVRNVNLTIADTGAQDSNLITYIADVSGSSVDSHVGAIVALADMNVDGINDVLIGITQAGDIGGKTQDFFYSLWGTNANTFGTTLTLTDLLIENGGNGSRGQMFFRESSGINNIVQVGNIDLDNDTVVDQLFLDDDALRIYFGRGNVVDTLINLNTSASVVYNRPAADDFSITSATVFDFNGDNIHDIILAGYTLEGCGSAGVCKSINSIRVWYGPFTLQSENPFTFSSDGNRAITISGFDLANNPGATEALTLAAVDFDNDGNKDLVIGGDSELNTTNPNAPRGQVYIVWGGQNSLPGTIDINSLSTSAAGVAGLTIESTVSNFYRIGGRLTVAGDVNADGVDDLLIPHGSGTQTAIGLVSLLYGNSNWRTVAGNVFDLNAITSNNVLGSQLYLRSPDKVIPRFILSVNALDINGDNYSDIVLQSANTLDVILMRESPLPAVFSVEQPDQTWPIVTMALQGLSKDSGAATDINRDGFDDLFVVRNQDAKKDAFIVYGGLHFGL